MSSGASERPDWRFSLRLALGVGGLFAVAVVAIYLIAGTMLEKALAREEAALVLDRREDIRLAWQYGRAQGLIDSLKELEETTGEQLAVRIEDTAGAVAFEGATDNAPEIRWDDLKVEATIKEKRVLTGAGWTATAMQLSSGEVIRVARFSVVIADVRQNYRGLFAIVVGPLLLAGVIGGMFLVMVALRPLRSTVAVMRDIVQTGNWAARVKPPRAAGEMRNLAEAFNAVLERQQHLIESLRQSLDCVAHDLRTPLTRLQIAVENGMEKVGRDSTAKEALADSLEETQRVQATLNTLLDVAEAEAGAIKIKWEQIDAEDLLAEVADLYEFAAEEKNAKLEVRVAGKTVFTGDHVRLRRALANLVDNALKYLGSGRLICLSAEMSEHEVILRVEDDGVGIASEHLPQIWDRLFRADLSRSAPGMGLGLSLVRAIAEAHGGKAKVSSTLGRGSVFQLHLPKKASMKASAAENG